MFKDPIEVKNGDGQTSIQDLQRGNEPLFGAAFEYAAIGMALISLDRLWIKVNTCFCETTGYTRHELLHMEVPQLFVPEDAASNQILMSQLLDGTIPSFQVERRLIHKCGFSVWVELSISLVRDLLGNPLYYVAQIQNITVRKQMEQKLAESEQRYKSLIEHNPAGICTCDLAGIIVSVNPAMERILGYEAHEMIDHPVHQFLSSIQNRTPPLILLETDNYMLSISNNGGETIELGLKNVPIIVDDQMVGIYIIARDITQYNKDRESLRIAQQDLLDTVRRQQGMTFKYREINGKFIHTLCDGELLYRIGLQPSDMMGKPLSECFPASQAREQELYYRRAWQGEENVWYEGTYGGITYLASLRPIWENCTVIEVIGSCVDITERKRMETELRETKELLESFISNTTDAICVLDLNHRVLSVNKAYEQIFGWMRDELVGSELPIYPDFLKGEKAMIYEKLADGKQISGLETIRKRKNGELIDVSVTKTPVKNEQGNIIAFAGITRDITERKKTEELLRKSDKLSVAGQLAAGLAHEIRNPLTSLRGFLQLLQSDLKGKKQYFDIMLSELDRINFIVSEFLVIAKPEAIRYKESDLKEILQNVITLLDTQALLCGVQLHLELETELSSIVCSEMHLKQLFINLVKNSIEAIPKEGMIRIQVSMKDSSHVLIRIIDNGTGIPPERLAQLGEPFYTTKEKGTGLGLMMCFKIIEAHKGTIAVTSEMGKGTTIDVVLPVNYPMMD
jgi:two-component system sporulation sensor kinase A